MDHLTTLHFVREAVARFVSARNWQSFHNPKNLALSIAIEAAELLEHFQWLSDDQAAAKVQDASAKVEIADELADVLIYCLSFANQTNIDISDAIQAKLARNEHRFPLSSPDSLPHHPL